MLTFKLFFVASLALAVEAATLRDTDHHSSGGCEKVTFSGTASADNLLFSSPPDITNATSIADFIDGYVTTLSVPTEGTLRASGSFSVDAIYCKPTGKPRNAVQLLVPGVTYNKVCHNIPNTLIWPRVNHGNSDNVVWVWTWPAVRLATICHSQRIPYLGH